MRLLKRPHFIFDKAFLQVSLFCKALTRLGISTHISSGMYLLPVRGYVINFFSYRLWAMFRVSSAERLSFLFTSFCSPVRSNSRGGCSVTLLVATDVTVAVPIR